eukprot:PhF_6_TR4537/c0_g1_i3/m.6385
MQAAGTSALHHHSAEMRRRSSAMVLPFTAEFPSEQRPTSGSLNSSSKSRSVIVLDPPPPSTDMGGSGRNFNNEDGKKPTATTNTKAGAILKSQSFLRCGSEKVNPVRDSGLAVRCGIVASLSVLGLLLSIAALVEPGAQQRGPNNDHVDDFKSNYLYGAISVLTFFCIICIIELYRFEKLHSDADCDSLNIQRVPYWKNNMSSLLFEIVVHIPHPIPTLGWELPSLYFASAMFLRAYTVLRVVAYNHPGFPLRFEIFGRQQDKFPTVSVKWGTFVKVMFLQHSLMCFFIVVWFCALWGAFTVYIAERDSSNEVFVKFTHSLWFTFVTASTVGYGDMVPFTTLGKLAAVGVGILGIICANMIAAILAVRFAPSAPQAEIINALMRREYELTQMDEASNVLKYCLKWMKAKKARRAEKQRRPSTIVEDQMEEAMHRRLLDTAVQKAKTARFLLNSVMSDDSRVATEVGDTLQHVKSVAKDVKELERSLQKMSRTVQHQFTVVDSKTNSVKEALMQSQGGLASNMSDMNSAFSSRQDVLEGRVNSLQSHV